MHTSWFRMGFLLYFLIFQNISIVALVELRGNSGNCTTDNQLKKNQIYKESLFSCKYLFIATARSRRGPRRTGKRLRRTGRRLRSPSRRGWSKGLTNSGTQNLLQHLPGRNSMYYPLQCILYTVTVKMSWFGATQLLKLSGCDKLLKLCNILLQYFQVIQNPLDIW